MGLSDIDNATRLPGVEQESIVPVFGQCAVIVVPSSRVMSARNRLYRFMSVPGIKGGEKSMELMEPDKMLVLRIKRVNAT